MLGIARNSAEDQEKLFSLLFFNAEQQELSLKVKKKLIVVDCDFVICLSFMMILTLFIF